MATLSEPNYNYDGFEDGAPLSALVELIITYTYSFAFESVTGYGRPILTFSDEKAYANRVVGPRISFGGTS